MFSAVGLAPSAVVPDRTEGSAVAGLAVSAGVPAQPGVLDPQATAQEAARSVAGPEQAGVPAHAVADPLAVGPQRAGPSRVAGPEQATAAPAATVQVRQRPRRHWRVRVPIVQWR